jgi:hypothetical protein
MVVVTVADCMAAGLCVSGQRRVCRELGIDYRKLVTEGISSEGWENVDNLHVQRIIRVAEERERGREQK